MILFLYGPDTYRSRQKLNEIIKHYEKIHKNGLNLRYFDGENLDFKDFKNEFQQTSIFKEKKLAVLTNVFSNSEFKENFLKENENFLDSQIILLFYEEKKILKNDSFFKFLNKNAKCQEFELLNDEKLKNWIKKEFTEYQITIDLLALEKLIDFVGSDLWQMNNEIKKLAAFKNDSLYLTKKDIELLVKPTIIETNIFELIETIALKRKKRAFVLLQRHFEKGESPVYLLTMINYQFRNLLIIKSSESYSGFSNNVQFKMHPFVFRKTKEQTKNFTLEELKMIYQKIFETDLAIKTGKIGPEAGIEMLIAEI